MKTISIYIPIIFVLLSFKSYAQKADTLQNFDSGSINLVSFSSEDVEPDAWELSSTFTWNNSPYALQLFGNTWKLQYIDTLPIDTATVWKISALIETVGEIQGFGITDGENLLRYAFEGTQEVNPETWIPVYQGAFDNWSWNEYYLPVGEDWLESFGYLPEITGLVYINDRDDGYLGSIFFDEILDVTDDLPIVPKVTIAYYKIGSGKQTIQYQFNAEVTDPDSDQHQFYWDFGDGTTSSEENPVHSFAVADDHKYTVLLTVIDESGMEAYAGCKVEVGFGGTSFPITLNFVGDIMLARKYEYPGGIIPSQGVDVIFEPTKSIFGDAADISIANLECPLTDTWDNHPTKSIYFKGSPENVSGLVFAGIDVVTLANNHILDYLTPGMLETQQVLNEVAIKHSGAGETAYAASRPLFVSKNGVQIALLAASDRHGQYNNYQPFLNAGYNKAGFYNLTEYNILKQIHEVQGVADLIVMEWHAGIEYSLTPTDDSTRIFDDEGFDPLAIRPAKSDRDIRQFAIDNGADLVICHHPHIMQAVELYEGKLIAHSLGDFVFDLDYPETYPSMVLNTEVDENGFLSFTLTPVYIDDYIPQRATGELGKYILNDLAKKSKDLDTWLQIDNDSVTASVIMDTTQMETFEVDYFAELQMQETGEAWLSNPHKIDKAGSISTVNTISPAGDYSIRLGRELIWWGNMEDEGCTLWDLNHEDETWCDTLCHAGQRSLGLFRDAGNPYNLVTNLEERIVCPSDTMSYSLCGWIKTQNAKDATIEVQYFESRPSGSATGTENIGAEISGDSDWTFFHHKLNVPAGTQYFDVRVNTSAPDEGNGLAWFDDVSLICWEPWGQYDVLDPIPFPNDFYYLQANSSTPADRIKLTYTESTFEKVIVDLDEIPYEKNNTSDKLHIYPNPFNPASGPVMINYNSSWQGTALMSVYDYTGKKVFHQNVMVENGTNRYRWIGKLSDGRLANPGIYIINFKTNDNSYSVKCMIATN